MISWGTPLFLVFPYMFLFHYPLVYMGERIMPTTSAQKESGPT